MNAPLSRQNDAVPMPKELNFGQLLGILWRGKIWITLISVLATLAGGYYAFVTATPLYTTTATVVQNTNQEPLVDFSGGLGGGLGGDQNSINTQIEVLRSRALLEELAKSLDLISDPEFNAQLQPEPAISLGKIIRKVRAILGVPAGQPRERSKDQVRDAVVNAVGESLSVSNIRQSYVYRITAVTESPEKSAILANTLAEIYIRNQLNVKGESNLQATAWLTDRLSQLRIDLETAEATAKNFSADSDLINADTLAALNRQVKELRDRLETVRNTQVELTTRIEALKSAKAGGNPQQMAEVGKDRVLNQLFLELDLQSTVGRNAFDTRFSQLMTQAELELDRLSVQAGALARSIQQQEETTAQQSSDLITLQQLEREAEASRLLYEYFLSRLKETSVQSGIQTPESRVLSRAVVPPAPSSPRKPIILVLSLILGLFASSALVLIREMMQSTFRAADELERQTGYAVIGQIPKIPARRRAKLLQYLTEKPTSAASEAIRNLRTSVLLSDIDNPPQVIMSTSSVPGEGKTTQSLALAQNLAGLGKKVLLVEGDIRKRIFAEYFNIKNRKGLLAVLAGEVSIEDAAVFEPTLKADVLIGEKPTSNAADVFSSEGFKNFISDMRKRYDYIVIDTPPVLAVPDARVIGKSVDAVIYTVRWDYTSQRQVAQGLKAFESVNVPVTGLVLGQINPRGQKRYGYGDSAHSYSGYHSN